MVNHHLYKKSIILIVSFVFMFGFNVYGIDNEEITRAELASYVVNTYEETVRHCVKGITIEGGPRYIDLEGCQPVQVQAIYHATLYGFMSGTADRIFSPNDIATREQIAFVLYKMINRAKYYFEQYKKLDSKGLLGEKVQPVRYYDEDQVSDWAKHAVDYLLSHRILELNDQMFCPQEGMNKKKVEEIMTLVKNKIYSNYDIALD